ncbi:nucleoside hydrolase [Natrinema gelatinilyticum]|uniref:nucleoside hydrolase n=1 Tax=Natrinema gelatinilyticum TaxID=2961571 RepID=UPI0020C4AD08|nr:nucleoside hydrolase [Natrinema gelatinilyticum]
MTQALHLDVDPGSDDAVMIALALALPAIEMTGISTVAGNSTIENTTRNACRILELFDRTDVPVARGCGEPMVGSFETAEWVHGPNGIRGDLPDPSTGPINRHGAEFIVDQAREYGDELSIVAVGPMTNLATALALEPSLPDMVANIYLMGGAAMTTGNVTPMAEANFRNDAVAARRVVRGTRPKMVGLDATHDATVPLSRIDEYKRATQPLKTVGAWLEYPEEVRKFGGGEEPAVHDAAVVAHLIDDSVLEFEPYHLDVDTTMGPSRGAVVCDRWAVTGNEPNADVAVAADTERFRSVLVETFERL